MMKKKMKVNGSLSINTTSTKHVRSFIPIPTIIKRIICLVIIWNDSSSYAAQNEINMGTTILAIRYKDGVVVGADTRTSTSGYVSNRFASKINFVLEPNSSPEFMFIRPPSLDIQLSSSLYRKQQLPKILGQDTNSKQQLQDCNPLDDNSNDSNEGDDEDNENNNQLQIKSPEYIPPLLSTCCICRSGSAADTQHIADSISHDLLTRKILHKYSSSVSDVAHLIQNYIKGNDNNELQASLICAGYDHILQRGVIYSIDLGGTLMEQTHGWTCSGSGSTYILGWMDAHFPKIMNCDDSLLLWDESEAVSFVSKAIGLAINRDGSSGGFVRIYVINKDGKKSFIHILDEKVEGKSEENSIILDNVDKSVNSKFAPAKR